jgi:hypothetical protein
MMVRLVNGYRPQQLQYWPRRAAPIGGAAGIEGVV